MPLLVAVVSIAALGVAGTTLETTLTTDPDEEINPDWDRLPIGEGDAAVVHEELLEQETNAEEPERDVDTAPDDGESVEGEAEEAADAAERAGDGDDGEGADSDSGFGSETDERTLFDRLLALLTSLLWVLVPLVGLLALGPIAYRYRERLLSSLALDRSVEPEAKPAPEPQAWPETDPSTVVDRAWVTLVRRVEPEQPATTTPAECAALARDRGFDAEVVDAITTAFERVHYGGVPATAESERARSGLRRLDKASVDGPDDGAPTERTAEHDTSTDDDASTDDASTKDDPSTEEPDDGP